MPTIIDLSASRCRFTCTGADATRYLNGQVTQDIRRVTPGQALPACLTTAKGKLEAELMISRLPDGYRIDAPAELREIVGPRLEKYLIADDCQIADVTDTTRQFHILGSMPPEMPAGAYRADRWGQTGWEWVVTLEDTETARLQLPGAAIGWPFGELEDDRIRRGIPAWGTELDSHTLPPEAGMESTHISYTKGCYIGQEVISRLRGVGQVARKLCLLAPAGNGYLSAGMAVHTSPAPDSDARPIGTITSATSDGLTALVFLRRPHHLGDSHLYALPNTGSSLSIAVKIIPLPPPAISHPDPQP